MYQRENGFYWLIYLHWEYLSTEKFENVDFQVKMCVWADTVLNSGHDLFWNLLDLTEIHSVEDRKWFLAAHLLSFSMFDCSKLPKKLLFNQNNNFEQTQFWTVGVASLRFYLGLWRDMLWKIEIDFYSVFGFHYEYLRTQKLRDFFFK